MKGRGKLTVEISQLENDVKISITDTGKGLPKKDFNKIFEPGFTTKKRGWGLGLSLTKRIIEDSKLEMKLTDVEFQGDNSKATFYYTAEKRVDFRELIREYSRNFGVRVEMRQIGVRQEAAKIGGIGSCGRELCCSTWMTDFPSVSTNAARYQQLSINPQKISGQCGRLKCCLNFELDGYTEALKDFPSTKVQLKSKKGNAKFVKLDVFKGILFYFNMDNPGDLLELSIENVNKIIALNKKGELPASFESFVIEIEQKEVSFEDAMGQDNIGRFDKKKKPKFKKKKKGNCHCGKTKNPNGNCDGSHRN